MDCMRDLMFSPETNQPKYYQLALDQRFFAEILVKQMNVVIINSLRNLLMSLLKKPAEVVIVMILRLKFMGMFMRRTPQQSTFV